MKLLFTYGTKEGEQRFSNIERHSNLTEIEGKELFEIFAQYITREEAETFLTNFPKSVRPAQISVLSGCKDFFFCNYLNINIQTNKVTGEVNETGIKRRKKILEILTSLGY